MKDAQIVACRWKFLTRMYNLRGSDPEYILKLADISNCRMRAVAEATNTMNTVRLAVLAALNTQMNHLLKKRQDGGATDYQKRAHLLVNALDEVLGENRKVG